MKIIQGVILLLVGAFIGVLAMNIPNSFAHSSDVTEEDDFYYGGYCHQEDSDFDHFLEQFSDEDRSVIESYLTTLLEEFGDEEISMFDRHEIMEELFQFIEDQGIEYNYEYNSYDNGGFGHHRMH